jgi:hypothetical protein
LEVSFFKAGVEEFVTKPFSIKAQAHARCPARRQYKA